jgi:hypothetical protein
LAFKNALILTGARVRVFEDEKAAFRQNWKPAGRIRTRAIGIKMYSADITAHPALNRPLTACDEDSDHGTGLFPRCA